MDEINYSLSEYLIPILIWFTFFLLNRKQVKYSNKGTSYFVLGLFLVVFSTFGSIGWDYKSYEYIYNEMYSTHTIVHVEPFYFWLIKMLPKSYLLWRFTVWGLAVFILIRTLKRLDVDSKFASYIISILLFFTFYYLRNSLAFAVMLFGSTYIIRPYINKLLSYMIAILVLYLSISLHKSMIIYIIALFISLYPFSKRIVVLSIIAFPFLYSIIKFASIYFLDLSFIGGDTLKSGQIYIQGNSNLTLSIWGWLGVFLNKVPILILLLYSVYQTYFTRLMTNNLLLRYSYILFYIAFLFWGQPLSFFISERMWIGGLFGFTVYVAQNFYSKRHVGAFKVSMRLLTVGIFLYIYTLLNDF